MSKLQRLDERVAKLLTEAVHEVLEMVKETVLEYQEKTARTQRENENLKRKLQELNDKITKDSTSALVPSESLHLDKEDPVDQEQDLSHIQRQTSEFTDVDQREIQGYQTVHDVKQESKEENYINTLADKVEDTEHDEAKSEGVTYTSEDTVTINISHFPNMDNNPVLSDNVHASQSTASLRENHPVVKKESDPTDCATTGPPSLQNHYSGCLELNCNSSHNSMEVLRPQIISESHQHVFVHSGHNISKRHVFSKTSGTAFQIRRFRREHFQTKDSHLCVTCGKSFSRVANLKIHQRSHTGERPYGCVQCGRHFSQAGDLKKHKRVHTGEKPFYCNQCGKSFSRRENLNRHQKIHVGERLQLQQVWMGQQ